MAKRIVWSPDAQQDRLTILEYWHKRLGHKHFSTKLYHEFVRVSRMVARNPRIGRRVEGREERMFVVGEYLMFYRVDGDFVLISRLWDSRRNPDDLKL